MSFLEIIAKIKKLEIKTRQVVNTVFTGEYHSVFKGRGICFSEIREYQIGDDIRLIDWNITAKMGTPFVKLFEEERELNVVLAIDISASGCFSTVDKTKNEVAAEIAAVLGFSAINNRDKVGVLLFSDHVERYIPPKKGKAQIFRILREIFYLKAKSKKTSILSAIDYLLKTQKKKSVIFLISDFIDHGYENGLGILAKKHDVVPIIVEDSKENILPKSGLILFEDEESGETIYVNTNNNEVREKFKNVKYAQRLSMERVFKSLKIVPIFIETGKAYLDPIRSYFKLRSKRY
jgi:uncharacterized protein (DUF58 family)